MSAVELEEARLKQRLKQQRRRLRKQESIEREEREE